MTCFGNKVVGDEVILDWSEPQLPGIQLLESIYGDLVGRYTGEEGHMQFGAMQLDVQEHRGFFL